MELLQEKSVACPYCGEPLVLLADLSAGPQDYVEDCQVCCQPMRIVVTPTGDGDCLLEAMREND